MGKGDLWHLAEGISLKEGVIEATRMCAWFRVWSKRAGSFAV
jgi:hypothetical protein